MKIIPTPPIAPASYLPDAFELLFGDDLIVGDYPAGTYIRFPPGTKVTLRQNKIMSKTHVNGLDGTIKEVSGVGDFQITIEARLVALTYSSLLGSKTIEGIASKAGYALQSLLTQLKNIRKVWEMTEHLPVTNERLDALGIEYIVLETFHIPDNATYYDQAVRIEALSDHDYDLALERIGQSVQGVP
ncbi:MAG: hypothetical protein CVV45_16665 [Spirochaetae bacterium HGW-Spirochaetae-10]|nr:MAG: hypothetical protein CVV45_16665 [Spirochaetae bacterium HGW-Spirochaetae-10]